MRTKLRYLLAASAFVGGTIVFGGIQPAQADYVPFTIVDPTSGSAGTVITATSDTWCATTTQEEGENIQPGVPGTVLVEFGLLVNPPNLGPTPVVLDEVLASTTVSAGADGMWSAQLTVPPGTPPGEDYVVVGHCTVLYEGQPPTSTTSEATTTAVSTTGTDAVAPRSDRQADAVLAYDFYPAQFEVLPTPASEPPTNAPPAEALPGSAGYTG